VSLGPFVGFLVEALDVRLKLPSINPPDASSTDLDGGQLARAHERVDLGHADVEEVGNVFERHEARFNAERLRAGTAGVIHVELQDSTRSPRIRDFDSICSRLTPLAWGHGIEGV
jgi:hypothetical protein